MRRARLLRQVWRTLNNLGYGLWLVFEREGDRLAGFAGFLQSEGKAPNLIYGLHPDFCGKGYATEAAGAVSGVRLGKSGTAPA